MPGGDITEIVGKTMVEPAIDPAIKPTTGVMSKGLTKGEKETTTTPTTVKEKATSIVAQEEAKASTKRKKRGRAETVFSSMAARPSLLSMYKSFIGKSRLGE